MAAERNHYIDWYLARQENDESIAYEQFLAHLRAIRPMAVPKPLRNRVLKPLRNMALKPCGLRAIAADDGGGHVAGQKRKWDQRG